MLTLCLTALLTMAQEKKVQNKPYIDLRPLHLGILVGMNMQDIELENVGPQTILLEDGTTMTKTIVCDDDTWNAGFSVGPVVGCLGVAHIMEGMAYLVCQRVSGRFHCGRVEPQGAALEVVASTIAGPRSGIVHQDKNLVLVEHVASVTSTGPPG